MNKHVLCLIVLLFMFSIYLSKDLFNNTSSGVFYNYSEYIERNEKEIIGIQLERNLQDINPEDFHEFFNASLIKSDLFSYKIVYTYSDYKNQNIKEVYYSTNDPYISEYALLNKGYIDVLNKNFYSTSSQDKSKRISNIFYDSYIEVKSILSDLDNDGYYNLIAINGDTKENFDIFLDKLQ